MTFTILKAFDHSFDGVVLLSYEAGETRTVKPALVEGLQNEGFIRPATSKEDDSDTQSQKPFHKPKKK